MLRAWSLRLSEVLTNAKREFDHAKQRHASNSRFSWRTFAAKSMCLAIRDVHQEEAVSLKKLMGPVVVDPAQKNQPDKRIQAMRPIQCFHKLVAAREFHFGRKVNIISGEFWDEVRKEWLAADPDDVLVVQAKSDAEVILISYQRSDIFIYYYDLSVVFIFIYIHIFIYRYTYYIL